MMGSERHPPTLLLPSLPPHALIGFDLLSLTASSKFKGFTHLPPGWHFLFVGATVSLSARQGLWLHVPEDAAMAASRGQKRRRGGETTDSLSLSKQKDFLAVLTWDDNIEGLCPVQDVYELERWRSQLLSNEDNVRKGLLPYAQAVSASASGVQLDATDTEHDRITLVPENTPDSEVATTETKDSLERSLSHDFPGLTSHVNESTLSRILGSSTYVFHELHTGSSSAADAEAERIPGLSSDEQTIGQPLSFLDIDLKRTWPEHAVGRERTEGARDRSWRLGEVVQAAEHAEDQTPANGDHVEESGRNGDHDDEDAWGTSLLAELQFTFLMTLTLANWSCLQQWKRILELVLTCRAAVSQRPRFFADFLDKLCVQLRHTDVAEGGLFDVSDDGGGGQFLKNLLRGFRRTLDEVSARSVLHEVENAMKELQDCVRHMYGWELGDEWLRRGMVQLEDGEMVELETQDMESEDERGEYAPVIFETNEEEQVAHRTAWLKH